VVLDNSVLLVGPHEEICGPSGYTFRGLKVTLNPEREAQIDTNRKGKKVCSSFMLRVFECVLCSISLFCVYVCVRMLLSPRSIAGMPSGRALPVCAAAPGLQICLVL